MDGTFFEASSFNQNLAWWDVSAARRVNNMFEKSAFNADVSGWNVSKVTDLKYAFKDAKDFNQNLCAWGALLPVDAEVDQMFFGTSCPNTSDPVIPGGPFCFNCDSN